MRSINDGVVGSAKKGTQGKDEILVPLTSSLYVKGRLADREHVLVDVGTGYYVEKVGWKKYTYLYLGIRGLVADYYFLTLDRHPRRRLNSTSRR